MRPFQPILAATAVATAVPSIDVPACPSVATINYITSVPSGAHDFPPTRVDLCYSSSDIHLTFTAFDEINYFYNATYKTNDPIYNYEVMEAFIYHGSNDPKTYLEFEVAPNNVTFNAFIYNPSKLRTPGTPFDTLFIQTPVFDGVVANTTLDRVQHTWTSDVHIPLGFFNVDDGCAAGTDWRMNFFRTVVAPATFPNQTLGAWSPPKAPNFHQTPYFGRVHFL